MNTEYGGTFSTGPVWADALTTAFAAQLKPTLNTAVGGATADTTQGSVDLSAQQAAAEAFLGDVAAGSRPLMSYWFGANDIFQALAPNSTTNPFTASATAASNIADSIERSITLHSVTDFLVMNLPSFDLIPLFNGADPATRDFVRSVSDNFNASLITELAAPAALGANITVLDVNALFSEVLADPSALGYINVTDACVTTDTSGQVPVRIDTCAALDTYLFIDNVHPTAAAHARIGAAASAALAPVPLPAGVLLLLDGLGALALRKRAA